MATSQPEAASARMRRRHRLVFWSVVVSAWAFFAIVALLAPVQGEDWSARFWVHAYAGDLDWALRYARNHHVVGDLAELVIAAFRPVHVVLSPTVCLAFFAGVFVHVRGRLPRPDDARDTLALALASALVWLGGARAGLAFFHRPYLAMFVYGLTAVIWFTAAYRLAGPRPAAGAARAAGMLLLGVLAGSSNHHVVAVVLVAVPLWMRARRRRGETLPAWMWTGLAGLVVGAALLATDPPYLPLVSFGEYGIEGNFIRFFRTLAEGGRVIAFSVIAVFAMLVRSRFRGVPMPLVRDEHLRQLGWWFTGALVIAGLALLAPRWGEPAMLAPTVCLVIGGLMVLDALAADVRARQVLVAFALVAHAVVLVRTLPTYVRAHREYVARAAALNAAAPGSRITIPPYTQVDQSAWFFGEDLAPSATRAIIAESYGLGGIEFTRPFGNLEETADHELAIAWSWAPGSPDAAKPAIEPLSTHDLAVGRMIFDERVALARGRQGFQTASLLITNLDFPGRAGRPVVAERQLGERAHVPVVKSYGADRTLRYRFLVSPRSLGGRYPETYIVVGGHLQPIETSRDPRVVYYRPTLAARYVLLRCNATECIALESTWSGV
jgi:hypothetical protein